MSADHESRAEVSRRMRRPDAAKYLGVSESFLEKLAVRGGGPPYIRASARLVLYEKSDLDTWLNARRVSSAAERPAAEPRTDPRAGGDRQLAE